jgi:hypothetical protein
MPIGLWALHRLLRSHGWQDSVVLGVAVAAQTLCCIYYGIFFGTLVAVLAIILVALDPAGPLRRRLGLLTMSAVIAGAIVVPYMLPYQAARRTVGERTDDDVIFYSATPNDYLSPRYDNALYGRRRLLKVYGPPNNFGDERHLFPGLLVACLALLSLWPPVSRTTLAYVTVAVFAFDASLGVHGHVYPWLRALLLPYRGLRVPARFATLAAMASVVLAAIGTARLIQRAGHGWRAGFAIFVFAIVAAESRTRLQLATVPPPQAVDIWLAAQPRHATLELPLPPVEHPFRLIESQHVYDSIFHWQPLVDGISGFSPPSYLELLAAMKTFPDDRSVAYLSARDVRNVVLRERYFEEGRYQQMRDALATRSDLTLVRRFPGEAGESVVFEVRPLRR